MRKVLGITFRVLGYLLVAPLIVVAWLGTLRADILPQYIAQLILEWFGPAIFVTLLIVLALALRRWLKERRPALLLPLAIVASAALACGYTLGSYVGTAHAHGISINLVRAILPQYFIGQGAPPQNFVYDRYEGEDARLYLYRPRFAREVVPVLVYVHGGGWNVGDIRGRDRDLRWFADQGYLVVGVEYALSSDTRHLWNVTQPQIACALTWIENNAARFGGDAHRIGMFGESAGGNIVLNVGNLTNAGKLDSRCGGRPPTIRSVVAISPPVDVAAIYNNPSASGNALKYVGGSPGQFPHRYAAVSPVYSTASSNPPTLILTGLDDNTVPARDVLAYFEAARVAGRPVELISIPRAGHGFEILPASIGNQIYRQATLHFMAEHGMKP